jgi:hypothetical protein
MPKERKPAEPTMTQEDALDLVNSFGEFTVPRLHTVSTRANTEPDVEPLRFETLEALLARKIDAPRWLVPDMIPMAGTTYLAGSPKAGKSWASLFLAMATASGGDFFGRPLDNEGPVLIVDAEVSPAMLQERVRMAAAGHHISNEALSMIHVHNGRLFLEQDAQLERLKEAVAAIGPALVILDPLAKMSGSLNENDASDMARLGGQIRELTLIGGPAVVVVHHTVKMQDGRKGGTLLRGSSALWADADALVLVERDAGEIMATIDGRYCSGEQRLAARLEIDSMHTIPTARMVAMDAPAQEDARVELVLAVLKEHPSGMINTAIREHLKRDYGKNVSGKILRRALDELDKQGLAIMLKIAGKDVWKATC